MTVAIIFGSIVLVIIALAILDTVRDRIGIKKLKNDVRYWRQAYEVLVAQTGRDLNDGLGRDPRSMKGRKQ